jgi:hypothetical protein
VEAVVVADGEEEVLAVAEVEVASEALVVAQEVEVEQVVDGNWEAMGCFSFVHLCAFRRFRKCQSAVQ